MCSSKDENKTTATSIKNGLCYCYSQKKMIKIAECTLLDECYHEKTCRKKSVKDYEESLKKSD